MSDLSSENSPIIESSKQRRTRKHKPRKRPITIALPNGKTMEQRCSFAQRLGVCEKTVQRWNAPTLYVGNLAYIEVEKTMEIVAARIQQRNQPSQGRHGRRR
jgi:hypothetical protein